MTPRLRLVLLAVTVLVMVPGVFAGVVVASDVPPVGATLSDPHHPAVGHVAVPVRAPVPLVPKGLAEAAVIVTVGAAAWFSIRRRSLRGLPFRLGDVGDRWRALLFGAPPSFL
jgi:hypothetical protein